MRNLFVKLYTILLFLWVTAASVLPASAKEEALFTGEQGEVIICDDAELLSEEEEEALLEAMKPVTDFGHAVFYTTDTHSFSDTYDLGRSFYASCVNPYDNGVIFTIDMEERQLWISGFGECQRVLTDSYCYTITDNIYLDAREGDYALCAVKAFEQIFAVLNGKNIPQPMRYTCNFLLAVAIALLVNFFIVTMSSKKRKPSLSTTRDNLVYHCDIHHAQAIFTHERRVYDPPSSSGNSGGSSGGGGGGGSFSSSGGGHSF